MTLCVEMTAIDKHFAGVHALKKARFDHTWRGARANGGKWCREINLDEDIVGHLPT